MHFGYCSHNRIASRMLRISNAFRLVAAAPKPCFASNALRAVRSSFGACTKFAARTTAYVGPPLYAAALALSINAAWAADPQMPDPRLTPGAWHHPATPLDVLCQTGYTKTVRHVTSATKAEVFRRYGYDPRSVNRGDYEVDHLVALEIDGSNAVENLWPQSYHTEPLNAHRKDVLEHKLHRLVCSGQLDLLTAQQAIATNWVAAYNVYVLGNKGGRF
jgi:hypothetical protein